MKIVTSTNLNIKKKGIFYLGYWCFDNLNFKSIDKYKNKICKNLISQKNLDNLQNFSNNKKKKFSKILSIILQKELNLSKKYNFNLLVGHWLCQVVDVFLNRYFTMHHVLKKKKVKEIYLLNFKKRFLYTYDSLSFTYLTDNPYFNDYIYHEYLRLNNKNIKIIFYIKKKEFHTKINLKNSFIFFTKKIIKKVYAFFCFYIFKSYDYFFYKAHIPYPTLKKILFSLSEKPFFYNEYSFEKQNKNKYFRKYIIDKYSKKLTSKIDIFLLNMIINSIPTNFLESLKKNIKKTHHFLWPKNPKKIFTSTAFGYDDAFNTWLMEKKFNSLNKFIILQHGANYVTNKFHINPVGEGLYSDYFIQWGKAKNFKKNVLNGYLFNVIGKKSYFFDKKNINNRILFVPNSSGNRKNLYDDTLKFVQYLLKLNIFFKNIDFKTSNLIDVKLHNNFKIYNFDELDIYSKQFKIKNIYTNDAIMTLSKKYKLIIFGYNSTGFYEQLSLGMPVIMFMPFPTSHLRPSVKKDFDKMIKLNLIFVDPLKMSNFVQKNFNNIDEFFSRLRKNKDFQFFLSNYANRDLYEIEKTILKFKYLRD